MAPESAEFAISVDRGVTMGDMGIQAWETINSGSSTNLTPPARFWWNTTGRNIAKMLTVTGYPDTLKLNILSFYINIVCNSLGPPPSHMQKYKSLLTADGSNIEYSFSYSGNTRSPTLRFSCEPALGDQPLSTAMTREMASNFASQYHNVDLTWFKELSSFFQLSPTSPEEESALIAKAMHKSQVMLGFDFERPEGTNNSSTGNKIAGKAYFLSCLAATQKGVSRWRVVQDAIAHLADFSNLPGLLQPLSALRQHLAKYPPVVEEYVRYFAIDLVTPRSSRLKVYVRCPFMEFDQIWDFFTLSDQVTELAAQREKIFDLFCLVWGSEDENHATDGASSSAIPNGKRPLPKTIVSCFTLNPKNPIPQPKLCFRIQTNAKNDAVVARGLGKWFAQQNWAEDNLAYERSLKQIFDHRQLEDQRGIHCYITVSLKKGKLTVESYLSPELFDCPRPTEN